MAWDGVAIDRVARESHTMLGLEAEEGDTARRWRWADAADALRPMLARATGESLTERQAAMLAEMLDGASLPEAGRRLGCTKVTAFHLRRRGHHNLQGWFAAHGVTAETVATLAAKEARMTEEQLSAPPARCGRKGCKRPAGRWPDGMCQPHHCATLRWQRARAAQAAHAAPGAAQAVQVAPTTATVPGALSVPLAQPQSVPAAAPAPTVDLERRARRAEWLLDGVAREVIGAEDVRKWVGG